MGTAQGRTALRRLPYPARLEAADLFLTGGAETETNGALLSALRRLGVAVAWLPPEAVSSRLAPGDTLLSRLDVRRTLDGVEDGVWDVLRAERRGVAVLNDTSSLLRSHDKLATALALANAGVPHPRTAQVDGLDQRLPLPPPVVLKPRFGSWGEDVFLCGSHAEYDSCLDRIRDRAWFRAHGVIVQELVPLRGFDLRLIVACGQVVGAVERRSAPGEWRTNVALGGTRRPSVPNERAIELAIAAAAVVGGDLVGVDLLPLPDGGHTVLEVNGAVDFTSDYSLAGGDVFEDVARMLAAAVRPRPAAASVSPRPAFAFGRLG